MSPDFLCIGAQKAGTTWLYRNLRADDQFWLPHEKELHYFDEKRDAPPHRIWSKLFGSEPRDERWRRQVRRQLRRYRKRGVNRHAVRWDLRYFLRQPDDRWYSSLFDPAGDRISGEVTPNYSVLEPDVVEQIHRMAPDLKVIFFLRNPVERAWSHAMMEIIRVGDRELSETPDELFVQHFHKPEALRYADYLTTIETWGAAYPDERIFIGFLEDIRFHPHELLDRVWRFLGADPAERLPAAERVVHAGGIEHVPTRLAHYLAELYAPLIEDLDEQLDAYAAWWRYATVRLRDDPPDDGTVAYPLWESRLWERWLGTVGAATDQPPFASGTLADVRGAVTARSARSEERSP